MLLNQKPLVLKHNKLEKRFPETRVAEILDLFLLSLMLLMPRFRPNFTSRFVIHATSNLGLDNVPRVTTTENTPQ
jgi:hypothetical protein